MKNYFLDSLRPLMKGLFYFKRIYLLKRFEQPRKSRKAFPTIKTDFQSVPLQWLFVPFSILLHNNIIHLFTIKLGIFYISERVKNLTSYFEHKSARYILHVAITTFIVLGLIVTLPYWAYVLGMIGIACDRQIELNTFC